MKLKSGRVRPKIKMTRVAHVHLPGALAIASSIVAVGAVLPPGYEDELYCPPKYCLVAKEMPRGFAGPKRMFWECAYSGGVVRTAQKRGGADNEASEKVGIIDKSPEFRSRPRIPPLAWGSKHGEESRKMHIEQGLTTTECATAAQEAGIEGSAETPDDEDDVEFAAEAMPSAKRAKITAAQQSATARGTGSKPEDVTSKAGDDEKPGGRTTAAGTRAHLAELGWSEEQLKTMEEGGYDFSQGKVEVTSRRKLTPEEYASLGGGPGLQQKVERLRDGTGGDAAGEGNEDL